MNCAGKWLLQAIAWSITMTGPAIAGSVEGPYIVWVNLATARADYVDSKIREFANSNAHLCWEYGALLYMRRQPPGITAQLVRRAVLQRNRKAQRTLLAILRQPFDRVSGFDGVIVYSDAGEPRLTSLAVSGRITTETVRSPTGEEAWGETFCNVLPPISRRP